MLTDPWLADDFYKVCPPDKEAEEFADYILNILKKSWNTIPTFFKFKTLNFTGSDDQIGNNRHTLMIHLKNDGILKEIIISTVVENRNIWGISSNQWEKKDLMKSYFTGIIDLNIPHAIIFGRLSKTERKLHSKSHFQFFPSQLYVKYTKKSYLDALFKRKSRHERIFLTQTEINDLTEPAVKLYDTIYEVMKDIENQVSRNDSSEALLSKFLESPGTVDAIEFLTLSPKNADHFLQGFAMKQDMLKGWEVRWKKESSGSEFTDKLNKNKKLIKKLSKLGYFGLKKFSPQSVGFSWMDFSMILFPFCGKTLFQITHYGKIVDKTLSFMDELIDLLKLT